MDYDHDKVDDTFLALLYLTLGEPGAYRSWKAIPWEVTDRLFEKGWINDPQGKAKSVHLTDEGERRCKQLFATMFGKPSDIPVIEVDLPPWVRLPPRHRRRK